MLETCRTIIQLESNWEYSAQPWCLDKLVGLMLLESDHSPGCLSIARSVRAHMQSLFRYIKSREPHIRSLGLPPAGDPHFFFLSNVEHGSIAHSFFEGFTS